MKEHYYLDPTITFLNHGSFGACPKAVLETYQQWQRCCERNPVEFLARRSAGLLRKAREVLAGFVGAPADELVYLANATTAIGAIVRSLGLEKGDEILATDHEYGACENAWRMTCEATGARYVRATVALPFHPEQALKALVDAMTSRTRVLFVSHITSTTALTMPIAQICRAARERGILTVIDGAHAPGHIPLDLGELGADYYVGNCHKWLSAPKGVDFLHAKRIHHEGLHAPVVSWGYSREVAGHTGFEAYLGTSLLERRFQWQGTRDLAAFLSVPAAIEFQNQHDWSAVQARCHDLANEALQELSARTGLTPISDPSDFGQMVAIALPATNAESLRERLWSQFHIEVPITTHGERPFLRVSVQAYNTRGEINRLIDALTLIGL